MTEVILEVIGQNLAVTSDMVAENLYATSEVLGGRERYEREGATKLTSAAMLTVDYGDGVVMA